MPDEYISREAAKAACGCENAVKYGNETPGQRSKSYSTLMLYEVADAIDDVPAADVAPVRHGEWRVESYMDEYESPPKRVYVGYSCSRCGCSNAIKTRHCARCGAQRTRRRKMATNKKVNLSVTVMMVGKPEPRMEPNDALKSLKDCAKMLQPNNRLRSALLLGAEALEKMVPKHALILNGFRGDYYGCPNCEYDFPDVGGVNEVCFESEQYKFCPECGQALRYDAPTSAESEGAK